MIDPANPPKLVVMPFDLANEMARVLQSLPYSRVAALMARLDAEIRPLSDEGIPAMMPGKSNGHRKEAT